MSAPREVVITGVGVVSPIGIGLAPFWDALTTLRSGIGPISQFDDSELPVHIAGEIRDFEPKQYIRPRKSLKVMSRDAQLAVAAAGLAAEEAQLGQDAYDPVRKGVILGADRIRNELSDISGTYRACTSAEQVFDFSRWGGDGITYAYPLAFLKNLPNMLASHVSIAHDAQGPNNTLHLAEASSLLAISEATSVIERGMADCVFTGGSSSRMHEIDWVRACLMDQLSSRADPSGASRPFDSDRDGLVRGEGACVLVLEARERAEARGAQILARVAGFGSSFQGQNGADAITRAAGIRRAIRRALETSDLQPGELGHVNAHGESTTTGDPIEAAALHAELSEVPVTAPKSFFGSLGAGGGAVEAAVSLLALGRGIVPPILNYETPDPACRLNVIRGAPLAAGSRAALLVNHTPVGQAVAVVFGPA